MHFESARQSVLHWLEHFVEQPNAQLAGWPPCPYARAARLANRVDIRLGQYPNQDAVGVDLSCHDVVIWLYDPRGHPAPEFDDTVDRLNRDLLLPQGLFALADHPDSPEEVLGVRMNQGEVAMILVQQLDKLQEHARVLARRGYYHGWPEQYLEQLFHLREDPRQ